MANQRKESKKNVSVPAPKMSRDAIPPGISEAAWFNAAAVMFALQRKALTMRQVQEMIESGDLTDETVSLLRQSGILQ